MVSLLHNSISLPNPPHHLPLLKHHHHRPPLPFHFLSPRASTRTSNPNSPRATVSTITCTNKNTSFTSNSNQPQRTLFPGGYKRPEIKIPNIVLQLNPEDVINDEKSKSVIDVVDNAVSRFVGVVMLNCGNDGNGRVLYDAGCLLKSIIRDRAYLVIDERVDIATAVNASGVVVSDQG